MKLISEGDKLVQQIIGTKSVVPGAVYRWSNYTVPHTCDDEEYLYNNFTKRLYFLEDDAVNTDSAARFTAEEVAADAVLTQLAAENFLVPEDRDENAQYVNFCKIARVLRRKKTDKYTGFTVLPTTSCNARCIYCYEEGIEFITMSDETVQQTIEFIKQVHNPNRPVFFSWFGGEPLIGEKIIDKICDGMREANIEFRSRMTSNGSLITDAIIEKMLNNWNLSHIQITLDGVEEEYNRRKNYYFNYESAYWHIMSRIKKINDSGISLNIRVNVDMGNIDGVLTMLDDVQNFIQNPKKVSFDLAPLFDLQASEDGIKIWKRTFEVADEMLARGFRIAPHHHFNQAKFNFCMADSPYHSLVIAPDGRVYNCENFRSFDPLGDIWNGVTNTPMIKRLASVEPAQGKCVNCFSLPECTTFSGCSRLRVSCEYAARKRLERSLTRNIHFYKKYHAISVELADESVDEFAEVGFDDEDC